MSDTGPLTYHPEVAQGTEEWHALRCGMLTASAMPYLLTPTFKIGRNEKVRAHMHELLAQRITRHVEPQYVSNDMLRGLADEALARALYAEKVEPVREMGFIVNRRHGFTLGYSPDGLVGDDGQIEVKSRRQRFQVETILNLAHGPALPADFEIQVQAGLLVSERKWCDFISYSGGLPMVVFRVWPDRQMHETMLEAAGAFEADLAERMGQWQSDCPAYARLYPTERVGDGEIMSWST